MANGVYKEWIEGEGLETVCNWAKLGWTDQQIIKAMGIKERTFYLWQTKFPAFRQALKDAKRNPNIEIETSMIDLACGKAFIEEIRSVLDPKTGTIIKIEKLKKQIPPNPTMLIFLAKNRMRDRYRDYFPTDDSKQSDDSIQQDVQIYLPDNGSDKDDS